MQRLEGLATKVLPRFAPGEIHLLGPALAPYARLNNLHRWHLIIKALSPNLLAAAIAALEAVYQPPGRISIQIDIDPISLM